MSPTQADYRAFVSLPCPDDMRSLYYSAREIADVYRLCGSSRGTARYFGTTAPTIVVRLKRGGYGSIVKGRGGANNPMGRRRRDE